MLRFNNFAFCHLVLLCADNSTRDGRCVGGGKTEQRRGIETRGTDDGQSYSIPIQVRRYNCSSTNECRCQSVTYQPHVKKHARPLTASRFGMRFGKLWSHKLCLLRLPCFVERLKNVYSNS